jgi:hypothetical protein
VNGYTDIRVCSFLKFDDNGSLRFAHKSYFEFFVAQNFFIRMHESSDALGDYANLNFNKEIMYFLGSFARDDELFGQLIVITAEQKPHFRNFLYRIILASGVFLNRLAIHNAEVQDVEVRKISISDVKFNTVTFVQVDFRHIQAYLWIIERCKLRQTIIKYSEFTTCEIDITIDVCELQEVRFSKSRLLLKGHEWHFDQVMFSDSAVNLEGYGRFIKTTFNGCSSISLGKNLSLLSGSQVKFKNSSLFGQGLHKWHEPDVQIEFNECLLLGVMLEMADLHEATGLPLKCSGAKKPGENLQQMVKIINCRGIIFTNDRDGTLKSDVTKRFGKALAGIRIVDVTSFKRGLRKRHEKNLAGYRIRSDKDRSEDASLNEEDIISTNLVESLEREIKEHRWENLLFDGPLAEIFNL